jgi:hypothetical protein
MDGPHEGIGQAAARIARRCGGAGYPPPRAPSVAAYLLSQLVDTALAGEGAAGKRSTVFRLRVVVVFLLILASLDGAVRINHRAPLPVARLWLGGRGDDKSLYGRLVVLGSPMLIWPISRRHRY